MHTFLCLLSAFIGSSASTARETIANAYSASHRMQAYYGSAFGMGQLSGSIYLNHVAIYAIEAPAYAASGFLIDRVGRRPVFVYALAECEIPAAQCGMHQPQPSACCTDVGLCAAVRLLMSTFLPRPLSADTCTMHVLQLITMRTEPDLHAGAATFLACAFTRGWLQRLLAISSKFGVAMAYNLAYIYTEEMFPTTVRNTALVRRLGGHRGTTGDANDAKHLPCLHVVLQRPLTRCTVSSGSWLGRPLRCRASAPSWGMPARWLPQASCSSVGHVC
jgi:MFS family permease